MTYDKTQKLMEAIKDIELFTPAKEKMLTGHRKWNDEKFDTYEKMIERAKQEILDLFQEK